MPDKPTMSARRVYRNCQNCGKPFDRKISRLKYAAVLFCSVACTKAGRPKSPVTRFWAKVDKSGDCWLWTGSRSDVPGFVGYGQFAANGKKLVRAHRFSWELHYGPIPDGLRVLHRCDVRNCVRPDHLWLGTQSENLKDMVTKGRYRPNGTNGERINTAKLTEADVLVIRQLWRDGVRLPELEKRYPVSRSNLWQIATGKTWRHVIEPSTDRQPRLF